MTFFSPIDRNKILEAYREIKDVSDDSLISFYERNRRGIDLLDIDQHFDMLCAYCKALYNTANYRRHVLVADEVIEMSIFHNIKFHLGGDIYRETLFDKAASLYNLGHIPQAEKILTSLIAMDADNLTYRYFMRKCLRRRIPSYVGEGRKWCVILCALSALIIAVELFLMSRVNSGILDAVELTRNTLFFSGTGILLITEGLHRYQTWTKVKNLKP